MKIHLSIIALALALTASAQRKVTILTDGWQFSNNEKQWENVRIPHDWAISGPFDRNNDLQNVAVEQNGEAAKSWHTGRTGGLPFIGKGTYRRNLEIADTAGRSYSLVFDGAMSNARVYINGCEVAFWPYGYNSFAVKLDSIKPGSNELTVRLENEERASRWYPGAGLYRNVRLIETDRLHIPVWGTYVTTPHIGADFATVSIRTEIAGAEKVSASPWGEKIGIKTVILNPEGKEVAADSTIHIARGLALTQNLTVSDPQLWELDSPALYTAVTTLNHNGKEVDKYATRFGIRKLEYIPEKGFFLNEKPTKFRGVCNHHDLGPLGAAVNRSAIKHQLTLLKDMGCNAIRTAHNMPAPELVELCDEMGIMLMVEPFDDWGYRPKSPNGYGAVFNDWAERDITNMVKHYRNSPSVVMWSIGNEVPSQRAEVGIEELTMLQNLIHRLDPTRPVTCGMDQINAVLANGFAAALDIPGFNYKPQFYDRVYTTLPQKLVLGSETASTVSSRGVYHFPVEMPGANGRRIKMHPDNQSSSYDNETCAWSNTPDIDLATDDDNNWLLGQFVWTGFDYLGEPSPYDTDAWPSHSSLFGIIDLASLPKDRYYLYRSIWNTQDTTLHILPHWNWPGREGEITPVMVYTNFPKAELFINGKSQGVREKNDSTYQNRYRLMWMDTRYSPGELRVVAYDSDGNPAAESAMRTAGKPHHLILTPSRQSVEANGEELVYVTIQVADKDGNIVPTDSRRVKFKVSGAGAFEATANGDATCLLPFQQPEMDLFSGAATVILRSSNESGTMTLTASAPSLKSATIKIAVL
ncbi:MAG: DUF4982 domain-containing protein [Bacteroides sp.]|nr:DUF4982 domain-containing protein [Bacteroides sp.]MCM1379510.1 DUF4982 domain-containing protein [Bacteroides sp.]MCM1445887.1 DUF4982 domain-containing protein [Prevotella sp.]